MDDLDIVMRHLLSMKELRKTVPPRAPKPPKEVEEVTPAHEKKLEKFNKKLKDYQQRYERWEFEENRRKNLRQLFLTEYGLLVGGSQHRAFKLNGFVNEVEEGYFIGGTGENYPNMQRFFRHIPDKTVTVNDLKNFRKFCEAASPYNKDVKIILKKNEWTIHPLRSDEEPNLIYASWTLDEEVSEPVIFGMNLTNLIEMLKLFEKLNIKAFDLCISSPILPILFITERGDYLICPLRIH